MKSPNNGCFSTSTISDPVNTRTLITKTLDDLVSEAIRQKIRAIQKLAYEQVLDAILNECINVEKVRRGKVVPSSVMDAIVQVCQKAGYNKMTSSMLYRRIVSYKIKHNIDTSKHYNDNNKTINSNNDTATAKLLRTNSANPKKRSRSDDDFDIDESSNNDDNDVVENDRLHQSVASQSNSYDFIAVNNDASENNKEVRTKQMVGLENIRDDCLDEINDDNEPISDEKVVNNKNGNEKEYTTDKERFDRTRKYNIMDTIMNVKKVPTKKEMMLLVKKEKAKKKKRLQVALTDALSYIEEQVRNNGNSMPKGAHQVARKRMYQRYGFLCTRKQMINFRTKYKKNNDKVIMKTMPVIIDHYDEMIKDVNNTLVPIPVDDDDVAAASGDHTTNGSGDHNNGRR